MFRDSGASVSGGGYVAKTLYQVYNIKFVGLISAAPLGDDALAWMPDGGVNALSGLGYPHQALIASPSPISI
ncbi:hypothetical protein E3K48_20845 [Salmonella enterica]|nr:hypothetical protein [Salmonella enterica subsp. arizonae]EGV6512863.1 hypothetical protein [Salmonella enterica]EHB2441492.1 hypothetical protein [Salmonella enterica]EJJ0532447.1 hypothetical protein [Salmonella enterica]ELR4953003.1 hypothetical protein [Salmonella enterica]